MGSGVLLLGNHTPAKPLRAPIGAGSGSEASLHASLRRLLASYAPTCSLASCDGLQGQRQASLSLTLLRSGSLSLNMVHIYLYSSPSK